MRTVLEQVVRRRVEVTSVHFERFQDVLVDVNFVIVSAQFFDYFSQENNSRIRITEFAPRLEQDLSERKHRYELRIFGRLKWFQIFALVPRPRRTAKTRRVRHQ